MTIPFVFASGYGENINVGGLNHSILTVSKPYDHEQLRSAVNRTLEIAACETKVAEGSAPGNDSVEVPRWH